MKTYIDAHMRDYHKAGLYLSTELWACAIVGTKRSAYATAEEGKTTYDERLAFVGTKDEASALMCHLDSALWRYAQLLPAIVERCSFSRGLPTVNGY